MNEEFVSKKYKHLSKAFYKIISSLVDELLYTKVDFAY